MNAPTCPGCGAPLARVLDLPYGYWEWDAADSAYAWRSTSSRVDVSPWTCANCLAELRDFHPQDTFATATATS